MSAASRRWFPFVQLEFAHSLGPAAGRYVLQPPAPAGDDTPPIPRGAGDDRLLGTADVLVVRVRGGAASTGGLRRRRRAEPVDAAPADVPITVATIVRGTHALADAAAADRLLDGLAPAERERWVRAAVADLNRAVAAYRVSAADPYVFDISRADPRVVRIGHGFSEEVFAGRWTRAATVPPPPLPRLPRSLQLAPSEGTAAILAGHGGTLESEELVLRVLLDLDQGRLRAAAVGLRGALDLLLAELAGEPLSGRVRILVDGLADLRTPLTALAERACRTPLGPDEAAALADHAEQLGAAIDRWRYEPRGY